MIPGERRAREMPTISLRQARLVQELNLSRQKTERQIVAGEHQPWRTEGSCVNQRVRAFSCSRGLSLLGIFALVDRTRHQTAQVDSGESVRLTYGFVVRHRPPMIRNTQ